MLHPQSEVTNTS